MSRADRMALIIDNAAPRIAVIFCGSEPRLIGTLPAADSAQAVKRPVDAMLASHRLSAEYISVVELRGRRFVGAHG